MNHLPSQWNAPHIGNDVAAKIQVEELLKCPLTVGKLIHEWRPVAPSNKCIYTMCDIRVFPLQKNNNTFGAPKFTPSLLMSGGKENVGPSSSSSSSWSPMGFDGKNLISYKKVATRVHVGYQGRSMAP